MTDKQTGFTFFFAADNSLNTSSASPGNDCVAGTIAQIYSYTRDRLRFYNL